MSSRRREFWRGLCNRDETGSMAVIHFTNVWGSAALLAIPAIIAIHFFRERVRRIKTSTLFLLPIVTRSSPQGAVWHRLRSSAAMWLQILATVLATWVLMEPRRVDQGIWRRVTLVMDDSASMTAFRERAMRELPSRLRAFDRSPVPTEWVVLTASSVQRPLYRGASLGGALDSLVGWMPGRKAMDMRDILSGLVASSGGTSGSVVWVTDHWPEKPHAGVETLAFGEPLANVGWVGVRVWNEGGGCAWEAMVRNGSDDRVRKHWFWEDGHGKSPVTEFEVGPDEIRTIRGRFPDEVNEGSLVLDGDRFGWDDRLPMVRPRARTLRVSGPKGVWGSVFSRLVGTMEGVIEVGADEADVAWVSGAEESALRVGQSGVVVAAGLGDGGKGGVTMADLDGGIAEGVWDGFLHPGIGNMEPLGADRVLVWRGADPLIWRGVRDGGMRLYLNFFVERSNGDRLPAMVLLLTRFLADVQAQGRGVAAVNVSGGELLPIVAGDGWSMVIGVDERVRLPAGVRVRAPYRPGRFRVIDHGSEVVLDGAAHFGDVSEAELRGAGSGGSLEDAAWDAERAHSVEDPLRDVVLVLAGVALVASWVAIGRAEADQGEASNGV